MGGHILFVCSGNTCRSPIAEALLRAALPPDSGWEAASAGLFCAGGRPASGNAVEAVREIGGDLSQFRSQPVSGELLRQADIVVAMTQMHKALLEQGWPRMKRKLFTLASFDPSLTPDDDIPDPYGGPLVLYRECRDAILRAIPGILRSILQSN